MNKAIQYTNQGAVDLTICEQTPKQKLDDTILKALLEYQDITGGTITSAVAIFEFEVMGERTIKVSVENVQGWRAGEYDNGKQQKNMIRRTFIQAIAGLAASTEALAGIGGELEADVKCITHAETVLFPIHISAEDYIPLHGLTCVLCNSIKLNGVEVEEVCPEANEVEGWVSIHIKKENGFSRDPVKIYGQVEIGGLTAEQRQAHIKKYAGRYTG